MLVHIVDINAVPVWFLFIVKIQNFNIIKICFSICIFGNSCLYITRTTCNRALSLKIICMRRLSAPFIDDTKLGRSVLPLWGRLCRGTWTAGSMGWGKSYEIHGMVMFKGWTRLSWRSYLTLVILWFYDAILKLVLKGNKYFNLNVLQLKIT